MKKFTNTADIRGYLYDFDLKNKVTGPDSKSPGSAYVAGKIVIATDQEGKQLSTVYFNYVAPTYSTGTVNKSYAILKALADDRAAQLAAEETGAPFKTAYPVFLTAGTGAAKYSIMGANISLNEYYTFETAEPEFRSGKRLAGGHVNKENHLADADFGTKFSVDMLITATKLIEANPEKGYAERLEVIGSVFTFRGEMLPLSFTTLNPLAIGYFQSLDVSNANPILTGLRGKISYLSSTAAAIVEEGAFSEEAITGSTRALSVYEITYANKVPYEFGDPDVLTAEDVAKMVSDREVLLASTKARNLEYHNKHKAPAFPVAPAVPTAPAAPVAPVASAGGYSF